MMSAPRFTTITLDGPAGVGKTTLARALSEELGMPCLDTGAMFRCLALRLGEAGLELPDARLAELCGRYRFSLSGCGAGTALSCDGQPIGQEIRTEKAGILASKYATKVAVREVLLKAQRDLGAKSSLVGDGRDLGTVVFPHARFKFFLDASPEIRARRRWLELREKGNAASLEDLAERIRERDQQDRNRAIAPLRPASDARIIDTSNLDIPEVLARMLAHIASGGGTATAGRACSH